MERLAEIAFLLPDAPESHRFLDELRTLFAQVAYARLTRSAHTADGVGDRLTLTPPQPVGARPVTAFEIADVSMPDVALGAGRSVGARAADGTREPGCCRPTWSRRTSSAGSQVTSGVSITRA
ncbi:hypothetical protein QBA94_41145 [Streptomyces scabiei]|uniref:hypothetical protein n=1 Tax=Streptomyces scabiei TaxID=1930 RepID=UPI002FEEF2DD